MKDKFLAYALLFFGVLCLLTAIGELNTYIIPGNANMLQQIRAFGGIILAIIMWVIAIGILRKK